MSEPTWIGRTIGGRYQIEELLGQGGMSAVYKATDPNLRRVVAVKIIHPHLSGDQEFVRRFEEEAAAVAQLRHPNIIQVHDFSHDGGTYFIVFEFVPGESLQDWLKRLNESGRRMDYKEAAAIAAGIADALHYAHGKGLVHRDVKPANVIINVQSQPILMDFGIAKIVGGSQHTATGAVLGTARYMSPEQIQGQRIDARTDIYSLGVMLFEMVSGRAPFEAESAMTLMMMHVQDTPPNVNDLRPDVPAALAYVIDKALAKNPANRYQSAAEFAAALRQLDTASLRIPPVGTSAGPQPRPVAETPSQQAAALPVVPSKPKINPLLKWPAIVGGGLVILLFLYFLGSQLLGGQGANDPEIGATQTAGLVLAVETATAVPPTSTRQPEIIETATAVPTPQPTNTPRPTATPLPEVVITGVTVENGVYVIDYETIGYIPQTDQLHVHLFYNTTSIENAGRPGTGPYTMIDHPAPSLDFTVAEKPEGATQICGLVANPDHTIQLESGNCFDLPQLDAPQAQPTAVPLPTATSGPRVQITNVTADNGRYLINFQTFGYTPVLPGMHVHFFFNTVTPENAGVPGNGPWKLYGGPSPFTEWTVADRPANATQMCALVANPDHSVQLNTGNCVNLP
ncbi:MAG: serine/threonine protein kinase [Ardenticatenaceae bacterium]|nr:serine/threonine protein kinase [Ardenticatenaceae bacterium]MCB9443081.1 serine/threonine protein kinase [Ardenticatenaceae bacterium]